LNKPTCDFCKEYDFKDFVKVLKCTDEGIVEGIDLLYENDDDTYIVNSYALASLRRGRVNVDGIEIVAVPKPDKVINTTYVYANSPLWTMYYQAWIFKCTCYYLAFIVSPSIGDGTDCLVYKHPVVEHYKKELKRRVDRK